MKKFFTIAAAIAAFGMNAFGELPTECYVIGYVNGNGFSFDNGVKLEATGEEGIFKGEVTLDPSSDTSEINYFGISIGLAEAGQAYDGYENEWAYFNAELRYNAPSKDFEVTFNEPMSMTFGGSDYSWKATAGTYNFTVNFNDNTLLVEGEAIEIPILGWGIVGAFNDWDIEEVLSMTKVDSNNFTAKALNFFGDFLIIGRTEKGFNYDTKYGASSYENMATFGFDNVFELTLGGSQDLFLIDSETVYPELNFTLTVNDDKTATLLVTNEEDNGDNGDDGGDTGSVANIESDATVTVYNFAGVKVLDRADRATLNTLAKGLYIVNDKKLIVK